MPRIVTDRPFVDSAPSAQNAADIFAGEWSSYFPAAAGVATGGKAGLFEDERITWAEGELRKMGAPGFAGQAVLELGPLEGGHTYMAERLGASEVVSVEANAVAYLKCLVAKEIMGMKRARFLLGDAVDFLRTTEDNFGAGLAVGFLYHMVDPVEVIALLAKRCRQLCIWTVVHNSRLFVLHPGMEPKFGPPRAHEYGGFRHTLYPHYYGEGVDYRKFYGAGTPSCSWMNASDVLAAVRHFGFERVSSREEDHLYGKALLIAASK